jgi:NDP-sugar pyrophosphorylase family protein
MQPILPMNMFTNIQANWLGNKFDSSNVFSYLGKPLEVFLNDLLTDLGVEDSPVIRGNVHPSTFINGRVFIAEGAKVEPTAFIEGPCIIGPGSEIRHGAYIRGCVFVGANAVVGHTTEVKGSVFLDRAKAGHFAYVGDSFLGQNVNLGAGTKLANLKLKNDEVFFLDPVTNIKVGSGLRKFSAVLGDNAQTGCNSVLSPGTLLFPGTMVMSCVHYRGTLKEGMAK